MRNELIKFPFAMGCAKSTQNGGGGGGEGGGGGGGGGKEKGRKGEENAQQVQSDPRLPLTAKQKYNLVASWKGISRAMEPTGISMFLKLFEQNEELLTLFEKFGELKTKEQQAQSMELQEHAMNVMKTVDEAIREMDNLDGFFQYLHQVGSSHRKIPGFKPDYFWKIEQPFLQAVQDTLGDRYTENVERIYNVTIKLIISTLIEGYEQYGKS